LQGELTKNGLSYARLTPINNKIPQNKSFHMSTHK